MKVLVAGDFSPRERVAEKIEQGCTEHILEQIHPYTSDVNYAIINFESTLAPKGLHPIIKCGPNLYTTENAIRFVKENGFDCITLANNHVLDYGEKGLMATIAAAKKEGLDIVGAGANMADAQKVLYVNHIAIVNICEHEYSIAEKNTAGSAPIEPVANYKQITEAKKNADYVLVICHGGHEHYQLPSPRMKSLYRAYIDWGADAVINHHQHCYSGFEIYKGKPICYGLGNFCFDNQSRRGTEWDNGCMAIIDFDDTVHAVDLKLIGYKQCADIDCQLKIVDFRSKIEELNELIANDDKLEQEWIKFATQRQSRTLMRFSPYSNRTLLYLTRKGWLPKFLNKNKVSFILNMVECESQRDVLQNALRKYLLTLVSH